MAYLPVIQKEHEIQETRARYDEALQPFNRSAPRPFPEEMNDQYRRRVLPILQNYAPGMQEVKAYDAHDTAFDLIEKQTFEAAQREAQRPTQIPEGELREVKRYDQAGRVSYEFYGKPSAWMDDFKVGARKKLVGIRTENERGYSPENVSGIAGLKY